MEWDLFIVPYKICIRYQIEGNGTRSSAVVAPVSAHRTGGADTSDTVIVVPSGE
jgi:hypothetical protein